MNPSAYIIAGPNGAGKTTFAREFLPNYAYCRTFINADLIASGLSPFEPEKVALRAGRMMLEEIKNHAQHGADFAFESTLAGKGHLNLIHGLKGRSYGIHFFYLWLPSAELALSRVRERVLRGGHNIPEPVLRRRFNRSITNFLVHYRPLADSWTLYDNTAATPSIIASQVKSQLNVADRTLYNALVQSYGSQ